VKHLGERFDIHTGGNDNKFPHHEDEIAQSEGAFGHPVVSIWVHGGFLQMAGQKMAKSKKNIYRVTDLAEQGIDPLAYRLLVLGTRYRSEMDFSWEALEGAQARLVNLRQRMAEWDPKTEHRSAAGSSLAKDLDRRFRDAVANDLDMPQALVVLNEAVAKGLEPWQKFDLLRSWDRVLGMDLDRLARENWQPTPEIEELVRRRDDARSAKDYAASDAIRDQLTALGLEVMDTQEGTRVRPRRA
jgi:cysteinyl-tRNA synthetase